MVSKIFLDANVLLDFLLKREQHEESGKIIRYITQGDFKGFVTPSVVHITGYWLTKSYGSLKSKEMILTVLNDIKVIDCSHQTTINALTSTITDIEDALQYFTAVQHKLDCFITLDKKSHNSALAILPTYYPKEFLELFI